MIAVIDYGVGNLFSLLSSLRFLGLEAVVTADAAQLRAADCLILPGVGAFGDAAAKLHKTGLDDIITEQAAAHKPLLGICLGMQLLFERGFEYGVHAGLGLLKGEVVPIAEAFATQQCQALKVPHMGWNKLEVQKHSPLLAHSREGDYVYYVHSYCATSCEESTVAVSGYGIPIPGVVAHGNVFGTQFHPEKSGAAGLCILKAFSELSHKKVTFELPFR